MNVLYDYDGMWFEFDNGFKAPAEPGYMLRVYGTEFWLAASRFETISYDKGHRLVVKDLESEDRMLTFDLWRVAVTIITEEDGCLISTYP